MAIFDITQSLGHDGVKTDGTVGTMTTGARMFAMADGNVLSTSEMAKLMGHKIDELNLSQGVSEAVFRHMLGMSLHKSFAGMLIMGLLASLAGEDAE